MKLNNPFPAASLARYPQGQLYQGFRENVALYRASTALMEGHNGIDIVPPDGKEGHPLVAAANGTVVECTPPDLGNPRGYGGVVRIVTDLDENGKQYELIYGHCDSVVDQLGKRVLRGDKIATVGNTGHVISGNTPYWGTAPAGKGVHLHFGMRELLPAGNTWNTQYADGSKYIIKDYNNGVGGCVDPLPFLMSTQETIIMLQRQLISLLQKLIAAYKGRLIGR